MDVECVLPADLRVCSNLELVEEVERFFFSHFHSAFQKVAR